MIGLMADLFGEGYGGEMHVDRERVGITWATFPHLYVDYYVFQYATGISAANALAKRIRSDVPGAVDDYLKFLQFGQRALPDRRAQGSGGRHDHAGPGGGRVRRAGGLRRPAGEVGGIGAA